MGSLPVRRTTRIGIEWLFTRRAGAVIATDGSDGNVTEAIRKKTGDWDVNFAFYY